MSVVFSGSSNRVALTVASRRFDRIKLRADDSAAVGIVPSVSKLASDVSLRARVNHADFTEEEHRSQSMFRAAKMSVVRSNS